MLYLANASSAKVRDAMTRGELGQMCTPAERRTPLDGVTWAADNGCYGKGYPGDAGYLAWLDAQRPHAGRCLFATAPDVVGDAAATLIRSAPFFAPIRALGYPAALVAQNGLTPDMVPWDDIDALFLGGLRECVPCDYIRPLDAPRIPPQQIPLCPTCGARCTEWKTEPAAALLVREAKARGKYVHMGRVNSGRRWRYAALLGCDSADGTFVAIAPDTNLRRLARWNDEAGLFGLHQEAA